jgi:membrane associated rhomboid family serine protease
MKNQSVSRQASLLIFFCIIQSTLGFRPYYRFRAKHITRNSPFIALSSPPNQLKKTDSFLITYSRNKSYWDGDDVRWRSKWIRRLQRSLDDSSALPARNTIVAACVLGFIYQSFDTLLTLKRRFPSYWPQQAFSMIVDTLIGSTVNQGSFTTNWIFHPIMARAQPHRYITAGFLHGGIVHLLLNMDSIRRMPDWLETGLGAGLYLSTFLTSIVTGHISHTYFDDFKSACLGASGGIMGLYGLMYVCLVRMGNSRAAWLVLRGLAWLLVYGFALGGISNAAHFGGFLGGVVMGISFGPRYRSSYALLRKNSLEVDNSPRDYRSVMGLGTKATSGIFPLSVFWAVCVLSLLSQPRLRSAPLMALRGLGL